MQSVTVLLRIVELVVILALPVLGCWMIVNVDRVADRLVQWYRDHVGVRRRVTGPPLQRMVADLHRLHALKAMPGNGSFVSRTGVQAAYDGVLADLCRAMDTPHYLAELDGTDLELERLRVEGALAGAGLPVPGGTQVRSDEGDLP